MKYLILIGILLVITSCQDEKALISEKEDIKITSGEQNIQLDVTSFIKEETGNKYGTGWLSSGYIAYYDTSRLEGDILNTNFDINGLPENSIQMYSKEEGWNKENFIDLIKYLSGGAIEEAIEVYSVHNTSISPFGPTCCAWSKYDAFKPMNNGILSLKSGGQESANYSLAYIFYKEGILYELTLSTGFAGYVDEEGKNILVENSGDVRVIHKKELEIKDGVAINHSYKDTLISWFNEPSENKEFERIYNEFLADITKISE